MECVCLQNIQNVPNSIAPSSYANDLTLSLEASRVEARRELCRIRMLLNVSASRECQCLVVAVFVAVVVALVIVVVGAVSAVKLSLGNVLNKCASDVLGPDFKCLLMYQNV